MKRLLTILLLAAMIQFLLPTIGLTQTKADEIYQLLELYNTYHQFNGSALVAQHGKVVHKGGNGLANMEWDIKNTSDTKHRLGSITKQFTAMLILQLVEEGKLDLHKPIEKYIPNYTGKHKNKVTLHHLLTHTSGIPSYTSFPGFFQNDSRNPYTPEEFTMYFADSTLNFEPGSRYEYSNSGYFLLGYILEEVTGNSYENELKKRILDPLQMKDTGFDRHQDILKNRATGYEKQGMNYINAPYLDMSIPYSAGSLYSTVEDLYKWDLALYTDKLLSDNLKEQMFTDHINGYGYGWGVSERDGKMIISHGGGINGFNTLITRYPQSKDLVVLLNNTGGTNLGEISKNIMAILYDEPYEKPKESLARKLSEWIEEKGVEKGIAEFRAMKNDDLYYVSERELNSLGYNYLGLENLDKALAVFELNTSLFPNSWNVYDSYGEALMKSGDKKAAIENYRISVQMYPGNEGGIENLKKLGFDVSELKDEVEVSDEILRSLVGTYELQPGFDITIIKDGKAMKAEATGQQAIPIYPKSDYEFYAKLIDAQLIFNKGDDGSIESFTLKQGGRDTTAKKIK
ncbi:serine hydrolase [Portibacter marinus]|uniref:serine hydrolase n=1 Tax=Portibacter marinus TaxID=2898660 RepID=UPI001F2210BD|nr:serine hydrolase [Portibacter marinus]